MSFSAVLRLHCRDVKGIVFHVSQYILEHGGNIITSEQYAEELDNRFFLRVHFDCSEVAASKKTLRADFASVAQQFSMEWALSFSDERKRMAIMVSKYDHCLYDLLLRHQYGEIAADIALILSNHPDLMRVAGNFKVPFHCIPVNKQVKEQAEKETLELFAENQVDFVVLARYMQILTPILLEPYRHQIINVHHGFLPAFKGARPYHQAYNKGVKLIGATSHYATEDLDMGPIIEQETVRVNHSHGVKNLVAMGRDIERSVLASAVKAHAEDKIMVYRDRTIIFD